jgi:3-deoxy-manno-octulosonate cytidylyltransferase (CMP-KDO synthetase)
MATPAVRCTPSSYEHLIADQAAGRVGGTTVVTDAQSRALYFSKRVLPYVPPAVDAAAAAPTIHLHLGVYAYRAPALKAYAAQAAPETEQFEGLEQLRFLHLGMPVSVVAVAPFGWDPIELNNPTDVPIIERLLMERRLD